MSDDALWKRASRQDLASTMGFVVSMPSHARVDDGSWQYGRPAYAGVADNALASRFAADMRSITSESTSLLARVGQLSDVQAERQEPHPYSVGPAAQGWPRYFFELYQDARPVLSDGASLLAWSYFFKDLWQRARGWEDTTQREADEHRRSDKAPNGGDAVRTAERPLRLPTDDYVRVDVGLAFTLPALVSLCYGHAVAAYGLGGDVTIDSYPRNNFVGYAGVDHPSGSETYLVRVQAGRRDFFYLLNGRATVLEHYLVTGRDVTLLAMPDFTGGHAHEYRQPEPSQRVRVRAGKR